MVSSTKMLISKLKYMGFKLKSKASSLLKIKLPIKNKVEVVINVIKAVENTLFFSSLLLKNLKKAVSKP